MEFVVQTITLYAAVALVYLKVEDDLQELTNPAYVNQNHVQTIEIRDLLMVHDNK